MAINKLLKMRTMSSIDCFLKNKSLVLYDASLSCLEKFWFYYEYTVIRLTAARSDLWAKA